MARGKVATTAFAKATVVKKNTRATKAMKPSGVAWLGDIPEGWEIGRVKNSFYHTKEVVKERAAEFDRLALTLQGVIKRPKEDTNGLQPKEFEGYQVLRKNELVFKLIDLQNISTSRVGRSSYDGIVSPAYIILHPRDNSSTAFACYYFLSMWMHNIFQTLGGDAVRSCLNASDLLNVPLPLPPLPVQRAIAAYLDDKCGAIDAAVAEAKKGIEEYKAWKKSLIFEVVTGKRRVGFFNAEKQSRRVAESFSTGLTRFTGLGENLDNPVNLVKTKPSGIPWIGDVPVGWKVMKLRRLGIFANGISKGGEFFGKGSPFVSYSDVYKNEALPTVVKGRLHSTPEEQEKYSVKKGDVFFTRTSETIDEIGFASTCMENISQATFAGFLIRFRPTGSEILPSFSKYYFRNKLVSEYFAKELVMVTRASLGQELLKSLPVMLPPIPEQRAIADYLDEKCAAIDAMIAEKEALIAELEAYKKSLIYEVVTGKREVA